MIQRGGLWAGTHDFQDNGRYSKWLDQTGGPPRVWDADAGEWVELKP